MVPTSIMDDSGLPNNAVVADLYTLTGSMLKSLLKSWGFTLPVLSNACDRFLWCCDLSNSFSVASAWNFIRSKKDRVPWASLVWDNALAPRFQFLLWLIAKNRLPTQVFLLSHGRIDYSVCAFCSAQPDSIDHLFFQCHISATLAYFWASKTLYGRWSSYRGMTFSTVWRDSLLELFVILFGKREIASSSVVKH